MERPDHIITEENIMNVVHLLVNFKYIAASHNQLWKYEIIKDDTGFKYLAAVDERTKEPKFVFTNPDPIMQQFIKLVDELGWIEIKRKYLIDQAEAEFETVINGALQSQCGCNGEKGCERCVNCFCPYKGK